MSAALHEGRQAINLDQVQRSCCGDLLHAIDLVQSLDNGNQEQKYESNAFFCLWQS